jgi:hypothetical protein
MERSLASSVLDGGGIGVSVAGTFTGSDGEVATHIYLPKADAPAFRLRVRFQEWSGRALD